MNNDNASYGVQPTGYIRTPLSVFLADLEQAMIEHFGPGIIQTPQSPLGQLNGLMADLLAELDEVGLDVYQSYDPDQAEGSRLAILGRLRLLTGANQTEDEFRRAITNDGRARIDIQDLAAALRELDGVTYVQVYIHDATKEPFLGGGWVSAAVLGGDDDEIAAIMRKYIVPGINTYGNRAVNTNIGGYCRTITILRPIEIPVSVTLRVRITPERNGCPPPSMVAIAEGLTTDWAQQRMNGMDVDLHTLRRLIECRWPTVELVSFHGIVGTHPETQEFENSVPIDFLEIAHLTVGGVFEV